MKVSIVIPCYNERNTIEKVVEAVRNAPLNSKEIIVVDDCSQDGTQTLLREKISAVVDQIIYHPVNRGKGAATHEEMIELWAKRKLVWLQTTYRDRPPLEDVAGHRRPRRHYTRSAKRLCRLWFRCGWRPECQEEDAPRMFI